jgi:hypothetical protein
MSQSQQHAEYYYASSTPSPLLSLPAELRLEIYKYLNLNTHTIEVTSNTPPTPPLSYRVVCQPNSSSTLNPHAHRRSSLPGLFPLIRVCRLLRAETLPIVHESAFAFSDAGYDYATTFPLWVAGLTAAQKSQIKTVYWPFRPARDIQAGVLAAPDYACAETWRELVGLEKVVLKWIATDIGNRKLRVEEEREFGEKYGAEPSYRDRMEFRRELAIRGVRGVVGEGVEVRCEKMGGGKWR